MSQRILKRQHAVNTQSETQKRTPAGDAVSALAFQLLQLSAALTDAGDKLARPAGQTSARWQVLAAADHAPSTVADMARALGLARQSVQRIADLLAHERLVSYEENPDHQRAKLVRLTALGTETLRAIQARQIVWANEVSATFSVEELERARATLQRLQTVL